MVILISRFVGSKKIDLCWRCLRHFAPKCASSSASSAMGREALSVPSVQASNARGLPCGQKVHAAYHAGVNCTRCWKSRSRKILYPLGRLSWQEVKSKIQWFWWGVLMIWGTSTQSVYNVDFKSMASISMRFMVTMLQTEATTWSWFVQRGFGFQTLMDIQNRVQEAWTKILWMFRKHRHMIVGSWTDPGSCTYGCISIFWPPLYVWGLQEG